MLELRREDKGGTGLRKMDVYINNENKGNIKDLDYKIFELNEGLNNIYLKSGLYKSEIIELLYDGENSIYNCGFNFSRVYSTLEILFNIVFFMIVIALGYNKEILPFENQFLIIVIGYLIIRLISDLLKKKYLNGFFIFQENGN